ncbi:hypothetical protein TNCV_1553221 [Trichonephila clavipes]|nr:hypothetical protein TNCV_1553221 [Trichonephila clavipes]
MPTKEADISRTYDLRSGRGSLVVKVTDRGWHVMSSSPVSPQTHRVINDFCNFCPYCVVFVVANAPDRRVREVHRIHHGKGLGCTPVVSLSFEHHAGDSTIWLGSNPILRVVRGIPPVFPFHQPHEWTCGSTAI